MLVRAARRKACPNVFRSRIGDRLHISRPGQAFNVLAAGERPISTDNGSQGLGTRRRRNSQDASSLTSRRSMATVGQIGLNDIPFDIPPPSSPQYGDISMGGYDRPLIYLGGSLATAPKRFKLGTEGLKGDFAEIFSVFDACIQVGRIERAGVLLRRISSIEEIQAEGLTALHNQYLRASVEQILMDPSESAMQDLHKWFELEMRGKGVPQDTETLAYMVKASLHSPKGRRDRLVSRYMDMLDENGALELLESPFLTDYEINSISQIYPKYNHAYDLTEDLNVEASEIASSPLKVAQEIPGVRPADQKGLGLKSLKRSLSLFSSLPIEGIDISAADAETLRTIQARLEEDAVGSAVDRWRDENSSMAKMGLNTTLQTKSLGARMWNWQEALASYLKDEITKVNASEKAAKKNSKDQDRCLYGPFLRVLPPDKLAAVVILSVMSTLSATGADKGITLSSAIMAISGSVEDESTFMSLQETKERKLWPAARSARLRNLRAALQDTRKMGPAYRNPGGPTKYANNFLDQEDWSTGVLQRQWPLQMKAKVGAFLMSSLIEVARVPVSMIHPETREDMTQMQPAFSHGFQYKMGKRMGVVHANKVLVDQLKREPVHSLLAKHLPMLVTPDVWTDFNKGGFIAHPAKMMRIKQGDKDQRHYAEAAIGQGDMTTTFKGLDVLGKTPWRVNQPVFDVMLEAWNTGEAIANIPAEHPVLEIPPEPEASKDPLERRRWIRAVKLVENSRSGLHSQRCFQNFQLEIARALRNEQFYFPHNVDFRGRAYPIPPYLNHMGADHCRGILMFGEGKELGESGLKWLKVHLANVFGFDKASLAEREAFTVEHLEEVFDSASNPLKGKRWWLTAEDPWQCLAACFEVKAALDSAEPTKFVSRLPIHQDGTCNGLQHYAALGGDSWGAKQVNLEPGDRPADVYTAVANLVKESIAVDKEEGHQMALVLDGKVTRKVVKQTVMTNVYGVTYVGAKAQVRKQLVALYPGLPNNDAINPGSLAAYIATKIFAALSSMFKGAHDIQYWLGECASRISTSLTPEQLNRIETEWPRICNPETEEDNGYPPPKIEDLIAFKSSVIWTTPLRMPVVQPYRNSKAKTIKTNMQKLNLSEPHRSDPVHKRKQLQGFPPNFVHSLDATHMLLSALECDRRGLSFAAVHDSFWTHASDIDTMNVVLRDSFIRIHSEDVIGRLGAEFSARYKESVYHAKIRAGSPVFAKIQAWRELHGLGKEKGTKSHNIRGVAPISELLLERKRMRLLTSRNPQEIEEGREMVTPASIFEAMAGGNELVPDTEMAEGLGAIPKAAARAAVEKADANDAEEAYNADPEETHLSDQETVKVSEDTELEAEERVSQFEKSLLPRSRRRIATAGIWLPLTFPPVPKKGDFDVSRLKNSKYFFS